MKKISTFLLLSLSLVLYYSFSGNPPNGRTGAPGESTCGTAGCHSPSNPSFSGSIVITGLDDMILPGETYPLTVTITDDLNVAVRAGFQMTNVGPDDDITVGTFSNASSNAIITDNGDRTYVEHSPADFFSGGIVTYTVDWTAPADLAGGDVIDFYGISVIANGSGSANDLVVSVQENATVEAVASQLEISLIDVADPLCFNENTGTATVEISGGLEPYSVLWSNGETGLTAELLPAGSNNVVVTDAEDNSVSLDFTLLNPDQIQDNLLLLEDVLCLGDNTGSITVNPSGGSGNLSLLWSTNETSNTISDLSAGIYSLVVTDQNDCSSTFEYTVNDLGIVVNATIETSSYICYTPEDTLTVFTDAVNPIFNWSNGKATQSIVASTGNYFVFVTDENGCSTMANFSPVYSEPISINFQVQSNNPPFTVTALPENGVPPYQYLWSTNETSATIDGLEDGVYVVTVTDFNNCSQINEVSLISECNYILDSSISEPNCFGDSTGTIDVIIEFETDDIISYAWNTGDSTASISNLPAGMYSLTFTNTVCTDSIDFIINEPAEIAIDFDIINPSQDNPTSGSIIANITNGVDSISYLWSTGENTQELDSLTEGIYILTISDGNSCQAIDSVELINEICDLELSLTIDSIFCVGDTATVTVSHTSPLGLNPKILWSTGDTTETVKLLPGNYTVVVSDDSNCSNELVFTVNPAIIANIMLDSIGMISCDDSLALIEISVDWDNPPFEILWSNGDSGSIADSLLEGEISVIISNSKNCFLYDTFNIEKQVYGPPSVEVGNSSVYLDSMGQFSGIPPLDALISGSCEDSVYVQTDSVFVDCSDLKTTFTQEVFVFNYSEIIDTIEIEVQVLDTIAPTITLAEINSPIEVCGESKFILELTPELMSISDNCDDTIIPGIKLDFSTTVSGTICNTFAISDSSGNSTEQIVCIDIIVYEIPSVEYDITNVSCFEAADGCIEIEITGGSPPYEIIGDSICNLSGGDYSYSIIDINGCSTEFSASIDEPLELMIEEIGKQNEIPGESDGLIDVSITGGTAPYSFSWTENGVEVSTMEDLINFPSSQYKLTVIDDNGCMTMLSTFIDVVSSVEEELLQDIKVGQNPIDDQLQLSNLPLSSSIQIISLSGLEVYNNQEIRNEFLEIDTREWSNGMYICVITHAESQVSMKIVKN